MVVAVGINEVIQFCPRMKSMEEFEVGGLDAEDKRRLLALGSCSTKRLTSSSVDLSYHTKDAILSKDVQDEVSFAKESNNNKSRNQNNAWMQDYGKARCSTIFI